MDTTELQKVFGYTLTTSDATSLNHDEQAVLEFMHGSMLTVDDQRDRNLHGRAAADCPRPNEAAGQKGYVFRELARCGKDNKQR